MFHFACLQSDAVPNKKGFSLSNWSGRCSPSTVTRSFVHPERLEAASILCVVRMNVRNTCLLFIVAVVEIGLSEASVKDRLKDRVERERKHKATTSEDGEPTCLFQCLLQK